MSVKELPSSKYLDNNGYPETAKTGILPTCPPENHLCPVLMMSSHDLVKMSILKLTISVKHQIKLSAYNVQLIKPLEKRKLAFCQYN